MTECYFCTRDKGRHWPNCPVVELRMSPSHPFFKMPDEPTSPGVAPPAPTHKGGAMRLPDGRWAFPA